MSINDTNVFLPDTTLTMHIRKGDIKGNGTI